MAGLFTTERPAVRLKRLEDVAVAHSRLVEGDPAGTERAPQSEVRHDGPDDGVVGQEAPFVEVDPGGRQEVVAVEEGAVGSDGDDPVAIAVERQAGIGTCIDHGLLQALGVHRTAEVVDVAAVRRRIEDGDLCAQALEHDRCNRRHGAVCAVDDERKSDEGTGVDRGRDRLGPAVVGHRFGHRTTGGVEARGLVPTGLEFDLRRVVELVASGSEELHAVVGPGVVRAGDHGTGDPVDRRRVGDGRRRGHAQLANLDTALEEALGQCPGQRLT